MKIVVPMSGFGERFRRAGYTVPKPLIEVDGKPIIAHVIDLFPGEDDFVFICNEEHLKTTAMADILTHYCPTGKIFPIASHKLGPVYAVSQAFETIDDDAPTIVNYCDFTCYWDYDYFKQWLETSGADGCVPAYRGFHPHSLGSTNYAFMRVKNGWMQEIQEKQPFTNNKMEEFASSGTYYFSRGEYVKRFFRETMARDLKVNNEYYCSVVYNLMVEARLSVAVYELQHFMQWGTPQDLAEYRRWSHTFRDLAKASLPPAPLPGTTLIPLAGRGNRFQTAGYTVPKPLISVSGQPMVVQATRCLPETDSYAFVCLKDHVDTSPILPVLEDHYPASNFTVLEEVTTGQACTCLTAMDSVDQHAPLTISACDHGLLFDGERFTEIMGDPSIDVIVWVTRGHPGAVQHPKMYGWVKTDGQRVVSVSVKQPLQDPATDPIVIGTFTFKQGEIFKVAAQHLIARDGRVNGEFYADSCIEDAIALGYRCVIFEVDHYLGWGTPNDLKTFEYWQSCFHKWPSHPYRWERDRWHTAVSRDAPVLDLTAITPDIPTDC